MKKTGVARFLSSEYFVAGAAILAVLIALTIVGQVATPYDPNYIDSTASYQPPSASHWFGTDKLGRDVFSRVLSGGLNAFGVGILSTLFSLLLGAAIGLVSGYYQNSVVDIALTRVMDVCRCIPGLLFALMVIAALGAGMGNTILAICFIQTPAFFRVVRGSVIQIKHREYVSWARLAGIGRWRIMLLHVLPNVLSPIIVMTSLTVAQSVLTETALSYLGLGVTPPDPSWGQMLSEAQENFIYRPWQGLFVGACVSALVLGFNLLGDGLRDVLDVRGV